MSSSSPLRVLHVKAGGWTTGGVESFVGFVLDGVDPGRVAIDVLTIGETADHTPVDDRLAERGGRRFTHLDRLRGLRYGKLGSVWALARIVRREGYRIVHIHTGSPYHVGYALAARLAGARTVILHSHTAENRRVPRVLRRPLDLALALVPTHRFACSIEAAGSLFPAAVAGTVQVVRNGIALEQFSFDPALRARTRLGLGIAEGRLVVGTVGRLAWEKNQALLVSAFAELVRAESLANSVLMLVGDGPDRPDLEALADGLGIPVRFLGLRHDVPALLQALDVFVLPSVAEGLGIAAIEAQACGLPCVLSTGVPAEVDVTGNCEFVAVDATPVQWAAAIARAAGVPRVDRVDRVRAAGYDAAEGAGWLQDFYLDAAGGRTPTATPTELSGRRALAPTYALATARRRRRSASTSAP